MTAIRLHGRGGQGAVTGAELIAIAAFHEGKFAQAFPFFGVERQGAPLEAYCRIADKKINLRSQIAEPDVIIVQDPSLLKNPATFHGIKRNTLMIVNSEKTAAELKLPQKMKVTTVPATKIALDHLGKPIINTALLGAFAGATKIISLKSLKDAIKEKFAEKSADLVEKNIKTAETAYKLTE